MLCKIQASKDVQKLRNTTCCVETCQHIRTVASPKWDKFMLLEDRRLPVFMFYGSLHTVMWTIFKYLNKRYDNDI